MLHIQFVALRCGVCAGDVLANGGRGSLGWTDPATGTFYIVTSTAAGVIKYNTETETAEVLASPCDGTQFR